MSYGVNSGGPSQPCSHVDENNESSLSTETPPSCFETSAVSNGRSSLPFPWKLHDILENAESENYTHIISWVPSSDNVFQVHQPIAFTNNIMPKHFLQSRFESFQRQLNIWGFQRVNNSEGLKQYTHEYFVRNNRSLCHLMKRKVGKKASKTRKPKPSSTMSTTPVRSIGTEIPWPLLADVSFARNDPPMPAQHAGPNDDDLFDEATLNSVLPPSFFGIRDTSTPTGEGHPHIPVRGALKSILGSEQRPLVPTTASIHSILDQVEQDLEP